MARDAVGEIRDRLDIGELVQGYVPTLRRTGRSFKGLCPFHQEKTPSFVVFPDSQNFHCFGCGKSGDVFTFYMLAEHLEFREALKDLAARTGVVLDVGSPVNPERDAFRNKLVEINELAAKYFAHVLKTASAGEPGRQLVAARGVSPEMVDAFQLGYAPDSWENLLTFMGSRHIDPETSTEAGLLQARENRGHYDRFRNRLMFPIRNREGQVVGFGGRALGDGIPKYLNSPQTPIFDKGSIVYGLDLAKDAVRDTGEIVIVEGYMDVIAAHQFGYRNVVASMGTALTESQVSLIKRGSDRIVMALDADVAGQMATMRGLETVHQSLDADATPVPDPEGIVRFERKLKTEIAIVRLPNGKDPDELIRKSPDQWPAVVRSAQPFMDFIIDSLTEGVSLDDPRAKSAIVDKVAPLLRQVPDRIVQGHYITRLSRKLDLEERLVLSEVRRNSLRARVNATRQGLTEEARDKAVHRSTEDYLTALLLNHPDLTRDVVSRVPTDDFLDVRNRELVQLLRGGEIGMMTPQQIVLGLEDELADHAEQLIESLAGRPEQFPGQIQREASEVLMKLGKERFDFLLKQLDTALQGALAERDNETLTLVKEQIRTLAERHRQYYPRVSPYFLDSRSSNRP